MPIIKNDRIYYKYCDLFVGFDRVKFFYFEEFVSNLFLGIPYG